jgi:hypothetical protein
LVGLVDINWIPELQPSFCREGKRLLGQLLTAPLPAWETQFEKAANSHLRYLENTVFMVNILD